MAMVKASQEPQKRRAEILREQGLDPQRSEKIHLRRFFNPFS